MNLDVVIVTSKLCNLRCKYCYELPLLSDRTRMSLDQLETLFQRFRTYIDEADHLTRIRFVWFGGEPLLIPPSYYWEAFSRQSRIFEDAKLQVQNVIQTNLTILDADRLELLNTGFDDIGVSLDIVGDLRVTVAGRPAEERSKANLELLLAKGIVPGGITVLNRQNIGSLRTIYDFYRDRGMSFRLLPLYSGLADLGDFARLSHQTVLQALCHMADIWFQETPGIQINPIAEMISALLEGASREDALDSIDLTRHQAVVVVNTDGDIFNDGDLYEGDRRSGNIFGDDFAAILGSDAQRRRAEWARNLVQAGCFECPHKTRTCNGHHLIIGGDALFEVLPNGARKCAVARPLLSHIKRRLTEAGILNSVGSLSLGAALGG
jgi:uncharacterized protein